jgi:hypothetical protein
MKKRKIIVLMTLVIAILLLRDNHVSAASGVASICYSTANLPYSTHMYTDSRNHITKMGYICRGYESGSNITVLECLKESRVFVAVGHGDGGVIQCNENTYLTGKGAGNSGKYVAINTIPNGSLNNLKIALWYGCNIGTTGGSWGNIVDVTREKGAKLAVGWTTTTVIGEMTEWNRLFFEKAKSDTVVESFRHADYWIAFLKGADAKTRMQSRYENGNINQTIY